MVLPKSLKVIAVLFFCFAPFIHTQNTTGEGYEYISDKRKERIEYPIAFTYINQVTTWPPSQSLAEMGVPGYAQPHSYNYIALAFWTCGLGATDSSKVWDNPVSFWGEQLGSSKQQVQKSLKQMYNNGGVSILLSAFGATQYPTTAGYDPVQCANKLGAYVKENNFDGVDIDYEDNEAMNKGQGQEWLVQFTRTLRALLPYHIITHAPQATYFTKQMYTKGGYIDVHSQVGHLIDFYNVQYYNQMNSTFESFEDIFIRSDRFDSAGSPVLAINKNGVPMDMIVVGKPASVDNVYNSGFVERSDLLNIFLKARKQTNWSTGLMLWHYASDLDGKTINGLYRVLKAIRAEKQK